MARKRVLVYWTANRKCMRGTGEMERKMDKEH